MEYVCHKDTHNNSCLGWAEYLCRPVLLGDGPHIDHLDGVKGMQQSMQDDDEQVVVVLLKSTIRFCVNAELLASIAANTTTGTNFLQLRGDSRGSNGKALFFHSDRLW